MHTIRAGSLAANGTLIGVVALVACLGGSAAFFAWGGSLASPSVVAPEPLGRASVPGGPGLPGVGELGVSDPNGSPFLSVPSGSSGFTVEDSLLPEEYANPSASTWVDSYVIQTPLDVTGTRLSLQVSELGSYSTALDSVALGLVSPGPSPLYPEEGGPTLVTVGSTAAVVAAHTGSGSNVTALLDDPAANASTPASGYFQGDNSTVVLAGFGTVTGASSDVLLLRAAQDPTFPVSSASGLTVEVQNPASGTYTPVGFVAPREYFSTEALAIGSALPSGSQPVVVRLVWSGPHALAWLALGEGVGSASPAPAPLLSATTNLGWNWTSLLATTDNVTADFTPGTSATLTFALPFVPPTGTTYVVYTNGAPWTTPSGDPHAAFYVDPPVLLAHNAIRFVSTSWDNLSNLVSYAWSYGDGTFGSGNVTTHNYTSAGYYNVTLNVTDAAGATSSMTQRILVYPFWAWNVRAPVWGTGNLCSVQTRGSWLLCQSSASDRCAPPLAYNFSASNTTIAVSLSGRDSCLAMNVIGAHDVVELNLTGNDWTYVDVAMAGQHDQLDLNLKGSGSTISLALYTGDDGYSLSASGSNDKIATYLVSADLRDFASPYGQNAKNDTVALSATGSNDQQNLTYVSFPAPATAPHVTPLPGNGRGNTVSWENTSLFASSWAYAINVSSCESGHGRCCEGPGNASTCCGWGGWSPAGSGTSCCGSGSPAGQGQRCCWWSSEGVSGSWGWCCGWGESQGPAHGCWQGPADAVPASPPPSPRGVAPPAPAPLVLPKGSDLPSDAIPLLCGAPRPPTAREG